MHHLTIRVAWDDSQWNGTICCGPSKNSFCLALDRIRAGRNDEQEMDLAGRFWHELQQAQLPPCIAESAGFMNADEWRRVLVHPYAGNDKAAARVSAGSSSTRPPRASSTSSDREPRRAGCGSTRPSTSPGSPANCSCAGASSGRRLTRSEQSSVGRSGRSARATATTWNGSSRGPGRSRCRDRRLIAQEVRDAVAREMNDFRYKEIPEVKPLLGACGSEACAEYYSGKDITH